MMYFEGDKSLLDTRCAAVVGSRRPTEIGQAATVELTTRLVRAGFTIVSGLANGVDTLAHETAIRLGGRTIACVPGGLMDFYPPENELLQRAIGRGHLVVARSTTFDELDFLGRNNTICEISEFCVVPETLSVKTGTAATIRRFLRAGKTVYIRYGTNLFSGAKRV